MGIPKISPSVTRHLGGTKSAGVAPSWPDPPTKDCDNTCPHTTVSYPCGGLLHPHICHSVVVEPVCRNACLAGNEVIKAGWDLAKQPVQLAFNSFIAGNGGLCRKNQVTYCGATVGGAAGLAIVAAPWEPATKAAAASFALGLAGWICSANCLS